MREARGAHERRTDGTAGKIATELSELVEQRRKFGEESMSG